jgi:N-acetylmuramoyl-L-alanine amidase
MGVDQARAWNLSFEPDSNTVCAILPAANFGVRRGSGKIDMLVLHYTGMNAAEEALDWLACRQSDVSCHYFIYEDGRIVQMVPEEKRAWHAGVSHWRGYDDINSRSIGIEIANPGHEHGYRQFPALQMDAIASLCIDIVSRCNIEPRNLVAHSDIAPGRKRDPGELFDWSFMSEKGLGHWVEPELANHVPVLRPGDKGAEVCRLQEKLQFYGYGIRPAGEYDSDTEMVVAAFQRHFRPQKIDGIADRSTIATLDKLLASLTGV